MSLNNISWILNHLLFFYHMFRGMEDFHINNTSLDKTFDYDYDSSNITYLTLYDPHGEVHPMFVVSCIITAVGLPLTLMSICAVYSLVRNFQLRFI